MADESIPDEVRSWFNSIAYAQTDHEPARLDLPRLPGGVLAALPAYAGLGDCYGDLYDYEALPPAEALAGRRKAVQKALALDPTLPEAILTCGGVAVEDWDWPMLSFI
jgi:hypothetical protein